MGSGGDGATLAGTMPMDKAESHVAVTPAHGPAPQPDPFSDAVLGAMLRAEEAATLGDDSINPESGLTPAEDHVLALVCELWGAWLKLPIQHPDERREVCDAVHVVQNLLCVRMARRAFPGAWVTIQSGPLPASVPQGQEAEEFLPPAYPGAIDP
jgi:hypothetical protein